MPTVKFSSRKNCHKSSNTLCAAQSKPLLRLDHASRTSFMAGGNKRLLLSRSHEPQTEDMYPLTLEIMRTAQRREQCICQRCAFTPSEGLLPLCCTCLYRRHICASFFKSLMLLSGPKPLAGWEGARSVCGLRSNFHDVWMCSLISLINNHFPVPTIRSWGYWPWAQVTDLLP